MPLKYRKMRKYSPNKKEEPVMTPSFPDPEKPNPVDTAPTPVPVPQPNKKTADAMKEFALGGSVPQEIADMVEQDSEVWERHTVAYPHSEYFWSRGGKMYALVCNASTQNLTVERNAEFHGGNKYYHYTYRGRVLVDTNDPRRKKEIEPDPGPSVTVTTAGGTTRTMKVEEFLALVNSNRAQRRDLSRRRS